MQGTVHYQLVASKDLEPFDLGVRGPWVQLRDSLYQSPHHSCHICLMNNFI